ncbi:MAG: winged helix-turn-helix domain-containing protein [Salinivirgaceae bacterium]
MVISKSELFTEEQQLKAVFFKALSHPARLAILTFLANTKTCISGDISDELPLSRTTVNQHLTELKKAGLIKGTITGSKTNYCLNTCDIEKMGLMVNLFFQNLISGTSNECS